MLRLMLVLRAIITTVFSYIFAGSLAIVPYVMKLPSTADIVRLLHKGHFLDI